MRERECVCDDSSKIRSRPEYKVRESGMAGLDPSKVGERKDEPKLAQARTGLRRDILEESVLVRALLAQDRGVGLEVANITERAEGGCPVRRALLVCLPLAGVASFGATAGLDPSRACNDLLGVSCHAPEALENANVLERGALVTLGILGTCVANQRAVIVIQEVSFDAVATDRISATAGEWTRASHAGYQHRLRRLHKRHATQVIQTHPPGLVVHPDRVTRVTIHFLHRDDSPIQAVAIAVSTALNEETIEDIDKLAREIH